MYILLALICAMRYYLHNKAMVLCMKGKTMARFENILGAVYEVAFWLFLSCVFAFCIFNMVEGFVS